MKMFWCLMGLLVSSVGCAASLDAVAVHEDKNHVLVRFKLSDAFEYKVFTLPNPNRIILDFPSVKDKVHGAAREGGQQLVSGMRTGRSSTETLRVVFDATRPMRVVHVGLSKKRGTHELILELEPQDTSKRPVVTSNTNIKSITKKMPTKPVQAPAPEIKKVAVVKKAPEVKKVAVVKKAPEIKKAPEVKKIAVVKKAPELKPIVAQHAPPKVLRDVVVVLDPGHGGKDPGALGVRKSQEKRIVLEIAKKLKKLIDRQPGMRAVLTRDGDYYLGLRERLNIARKHEGDVFVSIHADAFISSKSKGVSVFALSQRGATSEAAQWLAEKENHSELGGVDLSGLDDENDLIRTVLIDLSQTATTTASVQMGSQVLTRLDHVTSLHSNKVEQARFVVLKSPDIPSILVETGFISNAKEEKNLNDPRYQARITQAMFEGLKKYFWNHPPHGTRFEVMANAHLHVVRAGDTLPVVAERYKVAEADLVMLNGIQGVRISPGQKLSIPKRTLDKASA
ncbi:MAG: N-acetylmuramoyl-L-alanine amidase [Legionellaceae bacterium]|nr:N-acetylmuramoyl-L-alanine amidase [Legionellaceae bacterium]